MINKHFEESFFATSETYIHSSSIVGNNVVLGNGVKIGPFCTIVGNVEIGDGTRIHGYSTIGMPAQDINTRSPLGKVVIGKNCEIREFVTISSPKVDSSKTFIGDNCYVMNFSHVAHDVTLENNVVLINSVNLAGHVHIEHHCMLMANSALHQFCRVGAYSALAPFSGMRQDIPPFCLFNGAPGRFAGLNLVGLKRAGLTSFEIDALKTVTKLFFQDKKSLEEIKPILESQSLHECKYVQQFLEFVKNSSRGISRKTLLD